MLLVSITVLVTLAVAFFTLSQTKIYKATATIQIDPSPARPLGTDVPGAVDLGGAYWSNKEYFDTQLKIIQSRRVAERATRILNLHRDVGFLRNLPAGTKAPPYEVSVESAAQTLRSRLLVEPERNTRLVVVSVEDADPARAVRVVTALVDAYTQMNLDEAVASSGTAGDWLHTQTEKLKTELEESELSLHRYKKEKGILSVSIDDQSNMLRAEMTLLNGELTRARTRREALAARVAELAKINPDDPAEVPANELLSNSVLTQLRAQYLEARRKLETLSASGRGENHPEMKGAIIARDMTREALIQEISKLREAVGNELLVLQREIGGLATLFKAAENRALDLNLLEIEYNRLARSKLNTEKLYGLVLERAKASDLTHVMHFNNIRVVDAAILPKRPVRPQVPVSLAIGLIAGLALGVGAAFTRELLDRTIKMPEDIEKDFGFTYLGLLPMTGGASPTVSGRRRRGKQTPAAGPVELLAHHEPTSGLAEASRTVRTNILFMSPDRPYRRLLVTSAGAAEGKTTVACCIAVTMAQAGQRVLLVDCDLRRPRIHRVFGRTNDVGVSNILIGEASLNTIDMHTEVPNLSVLTAGPPAPSPAELLQSEKFAELLAELSNRFDRVIIDSPPLVPVTDAAILST
ncbi:MAG TPA: polysaccharide biosynthesis tyrosine autokinase, partial [Polyangiaceae bacterium]